MNGIDQGGGMLRIDSRVDAMAEIKYMSATLAITLKDVRDFFPDSIG